MGPDLKKAEKAYVKLTHFHMATMTVSLTRRQFTLKISKDTFKDFKDTFHIYMLNGLSFEAVVVQSV